MKKFYFIHCLIFSFYGLSAQNNSNFNLFKDIIIQTDSGSYSKSLNNIAINKDNFFWFNYHKEDEVCHVILYPDPLFHCKSLSLTETFDFDIIDSIRLINNQYYDFKIRFNNLTKSDFLKFRFKCNQDTNIYYDVKLLPLFKSTARLDVKSNELTVGDEKVIELITNNIDNIRLNPDWDNTQEINYRIVENNGHLFVHLIANSTGLKTLNIKINTNKPFLLDNKPVYELPLLTYSFNVKASGLVFLQVDKTDILFDDKANKDGVTIQMDNNRFLQLNKTYLVDAQETPGSPLIGTLFLKEKIGNDKVTGKLKIFNLHKQSDGYLYIKDFDEPKFITNLNIIPKTSIDKIKVMRNGKDWLDESSVYPGETVNVRLEGQSFTKAKFTFDPKIEVANDSVIKSDNFIEYKVKIPININKKSIQIYNNNQITGMNLTVKEYQIARPFDYINIRLGNRIKNLTDFRGPEFYDNHLKDVIISFKPDKIETENKLYGKQCFDIDVKVFDKAGELKDLTTIEDLAVCPADNSPRYPYYDKSDCSSSDISLNSKLNGGIYDLKDWSKIRLTFKDQKDKYTKDIQTKTVDIVLQKLYSFDIDVSFPAGLLIKKANTPGFGDFSGVSMAIMEQCSFYSKEKIAQLEPYKVGVGFIALNAFDFSSTSATDRDMGIVILGTINPVNTTKKLTFPIYFGGGYLLSGHTWFWLLGPGISVQF